MHAANPPQGFNPNNLNLTQALAKEVDTIPNTRPQGVSQAKVKQALAIVAKHPELREAIWQKGQAALRENPPDLKKRCEDIAGKYEHGDSTVKKVFVTLFASLTLGFAKFLKNPNRDLQIKVNGQLVPGLYIKLKGGDLVVTNLIDDNKANKGGKREATLLTLVHNLSTSDFGTGRYKEKPQPAAQGFQGFHQQVPMGKPVVYRGPGQHLASPNQFVPQHVQAQAQGNQPLFNRGSPLHNLSDFCKNQVFNEVDGIFFMLESGVERLASTPANQRGTLLAGFNADMQRGWGKLQQTPQTANGFSERVNVLNAYQSRVNDLMQGK